ncbi:MAG: Uma2 family endonuclease [Blastocatellia bacterium]
MIADNAGGQLEIIGGLHVWEAWPSLMHQKTIDCIRQSFKHSDQVNGGRECLHYAGLHYAGLHIKFPDGSVKHSDIAIFHRRPRETDFAVTDVPEAVIEIISEGYEKKDLELGPPFYLSQGVKDVIVYNPYTKVTRHFTAAGQSEYAKSVTLILQWGCQVTF